MKLVLRIDAPDDGDAQSSGQDVNWHAFEPILERELIELYPDAARYDSAEISVSLLTPDEIRRINREYRECDESTDVLSFPMCECDGQFVPDDVSPVLSLGDVLICPEETARLHPELSEKEALCLMLAHSFLHLMAWDHDTEEHESAMWARQDAIKTRLMAAAEAL